MNFPRFIRIAVLPYRHVIEIKDGNRIVGGLEAKIINLLSNVLGFRYQIFISKEMAWGHPLENGTWTGLIGMVSRNESDLGFGFTAVTKSRSKAVDFVPYNVEENSFATRLPPILSSAGSLAHPFQWKVWVSCFLIAFFAPILFKFVMSNKIPFHRLSLAMIGGMVQESSILKFKATKSRFLMGSWFIFSMFLSLSYTAVLLSSLTVPLRAGGVRNIEQLAAAISEGRFECHGIRGSSQILILKDSLNDDMRLIGRNIIEKDWMSNNEITRIPEDIEDSVAILGSKTFFHFAYGEERFSTKYIFEETVSYWNVGILVNKGFCCKTRLATVVSRFRETGIIRRLYNDMQFETRRGTDSEASRNSVLSMNDLMGLFVLLGVGHIAASVVLICEKVYYKFVCF
ncbi:lig_chan-Glu_bd domain-containing protein [Caerostris darwini]|uniref:Lig_chan-Glu_bd domain-containing protein n=1 Tax=Caerostris darwini TaxID=1538125 RepID=A0AAV4MGZ1_9ARAC|nr:lig_chan-Glu_bd domain-containing protein [Caerostris darwini]